MLAFLVRANNTAESRGWLDSVASALISKQRPCGSIREFCNAAECSYGGGNSTKSCFCSSNAAYGTGEGGIIQTNDDPAADLLYTQVSTRILGRRTAPFPPFLIPLPRPAWC